MRTDDDVNAPTGATEVICDRPVVTVGDLLDQAAIMRPDGEFVRDESESLTFSAARAHVNQIATALAGYQIGVGDRVAILLPNGCTWPLVWLAVLRLGAVAVPINVAYQRDDLQFALADSGASAVITVPGFMDLIEQVRGQCPDLQHTVSAEQLRGELHGRADPVSAPVSLTAAHLANLQYTSGTTGFPKACMLSHDYWLRVGRLAACNAQVKSDDVTLTAQPYSYIDPLWNTVVALICRIPLVVLPTFSASGFWPAVREHRVTFFYVLGSMPQLLFKQPPGPGDRHHSVRLVLCSGIPPGLHAQLEERWGVPWRETYGLTETGMDMAAPLEDEGIVGSGLAGYPVPTKQVAIVDEHGKPLPAGHEGEIVVRGLPMMDGYWNRPEATAAALSAGWFHTGDLGVRDVEGRYRIVGRLKDMIRRGGENVSAAEVENVLNQHPAVRNSAVVAEPDPLWGEVVKAFVCLSEHSVADAGTARSILAHARGKLATFKVPRYVQFVDGFPMTASERVAKTQLAEQWENNVTGLFDVQNLPSP